MSLEKQPTQQVDVTSLITNKLVLVLYMAKLLYIKMVNTSLVLLVKDRLNSLMWEMETLELVYTQTIKNLVPISSKTRTAHMSGFVVP